MTPGRIAGRHARRPELRDSLWSVSDLLDAVIHYLPSPLDRPPVEAELVSGNKAGDLVARKPDPSEPLLALAFRGFGHPAVITVAAVLVISRTLQVSGVIDMIATGLKALLPGLA